VLSVDTRERWEVVFDGLRSLILSGELQPGGRLLENDLADRFRVSRGPVREAIRQLEVAGLAIRTQRRGSFVAPLAVTDVEEIYTLRASIEELAIRRALARQSPQTMAMLRVHLEEMRGIPEGGQRRDLAEVDLAFHSAFYEGAAHRRLQAVWLSLADPLRLMIALTAGRSEAEHEVTISGHEEIYRAADRGDVEGCVAAMHTHLEVALTSISGYLDRRRPWASAGVDSGDLGSPR
jgi:GntR family transcriptional regulator, gluconate operon transcriptional repressor